MIKNGKLSLEYRTAKYKSVINIDEKITRKFDNEIVARFDYRHFKQILQIIKAEKQKNYQMKFGDGCICVVAKDGSEKYVISEQVKRQVKIVKVEKLNIEPKYEITSKAPDDWDYEKSVEKV